MFTEQAPLAGNCCACAILAASHLQLLAVLDGLLKPMQNVCNRSPHLSEEPGGSHGRHDQSRYTLSRHVSECVLHPRRHVDDVTARSRRSFALVDGQVVERDVIHLNISVDHDIIDGAPLVRFAERLKKILLDGRALSTCAA